MTVYDNMAFGMQHRAASARQEIDTPGARRRPRSCSSTQYLDRLPKAAVRRPAPARRHRPRHRAQPEGVPVRRAAVQPRRRAARRHPHRDRQAQGAHAQHHDDLRHPRPGRGDDAGRPHRRAQGRPYRAGRLADGALQAARQPVRRPVHRLAGDEHPAGDDRARPAARPSSAMSAAARRRVPIETPAAAAGSGDQLRRAAGGPGDRHRSPTILFEGPVDYVEQLGEVQLVYVDIGRADQPLVAKLPGNAGQARGRR